MRDYFRRLTVVGLVVGCVVCGALVVHQVRTMPQSAWDCIAAGRWDVGPFERPVVPVRLSDRSTDHMSCGAACKEKGVGR